MTQKPKCYFSLVFLTLMLSWVKFNRKIKTYWNAWFQWIRFGIGCLCDRKIQKFKSSMLQSPYSGYLSTCSWTSYQQCTLWSHVSYSDLPRIELVHGYGDTVQAHVRYASAYLLPLTKWFTKNIQLFNWYWVLDLDSSSGPSSDIASGLFLPCKFKTVDYQK